MCANCIKSREDAWAGIRDLLNYNRKVNGPISEGIKKRVELALADPDVPEISDEDLSEMVEMIRAQRIAELCVVIARCAESGEFHMAPPHVIMGAWAGDLMKEQIIHAISENGIFGMLMGFGVPETDDDDDD